MNHRDVRFMAIIPGTGSREKNEHLNPVYHELQVPSTTIQ